MFCHLSWCLAIAFYSSTAFALSIEKVLAFNPFAVRVGCKAPTPYIYPIADSPTVVFTVPLSDLDAEFIAFNFSFFHLPPSDYIQIRASNSTTPLYKYNGWYPKGFLSTAIFSSSVVIELVSFGSTNSNCDYGFEINSYQFSATPPSRESACDASNVAVSPACDQRLMSPYWRGAKGVVRLLINAVDGARWCTGWLLGCQNHVLTNHHCIATEADAASTVFDFRAYGKCGDNCVGGGTCSSGNVVVGSSLIATSESLDYALVQLNTPTNWSAGNYLKLQPNILVGDPVFIPQHPLGGGMVVAIKAFEGRFGLLQTTTYSNDDCGLGGMVGYKLNTFPGSSGSPVISSTTNSVVAMHSCGGCAVSSDSSMNGGIPSSWIIQDLQRKNSLPLCAVANTYQQSDNLLIDFKVVQGTLFQRDSGVSIDVYTISFAYDGMISLDILSYERSTRGGFQDVDGNCDASYIDSKLYLLDAYGAILAVNDNSVGVNGRSDGSISDFDAYLNFNVDPGQYYILVGTSDMTDIDAYAAADVSSPKYSAGSMFSCGLPTAGYGHYTLTIRTTIEQDSILSFTSPNSYLPTACGDGKAKKTYTECPYHEEQEVKLKYLVEGTIHQTNDTVSIDHIFFEVYEPAHIAVEFVSYQVLDNGELLPHGYDEYGLCGRTYIDPIAYLFEDTTNNQLQLIDTTKLVTVVDDRPTGIKTPTRTSLSVRDPLFDLFLPKGKYILVVGQYPLKLHETIRTSTSVKSEFTPLKLGKPFNKGNYHILFTAEKDGVLSAPSIPPNYVEEPCIV